MPASAFITAMNFLYEGKREAGLRIARDCLLEMVCVQGMTWDQPNMLIGTPQEHRRVYGTDYGQCLSLWGLPAALAEEGLEGPCLPGGLVDRVIEAAARG